MTTFIAGISHELWTSQKTTRTIARKRWNWMNSRLHYPLTPPGNIKDGMATGRQSLCSNDWLAGVLALHLEEKTYNWHSIKAHFATESDDDDGKFVDSASSKGFVWMDSSGTLYHSGLGELFKFICGASVAFDFTQIRVWREEWMGTWLAVWDCEWVINRVPHFLCKIYRPHSQW